MKVISQLAVLALAGLSAAWPHLPTRIFGKRQVESQMTDVDILRYALTLEHLEDKFYREGLANYSLSDFTTAGYTSTFYTNLQEISADETEHVNFLTSALEAAGVAPTVQCTYDFGISSLAQFVATAAVLEGVGVSAYLGAAAQISTKAYLTAAGSILTIEARHNAYLRASLSEAPFPQPFDATLTPDEVHTLAHDFIVSCPAGNPTFPVRFFPGLTVTSTGQISTGQVINVQTSGYVLAPEDPTAELYASFAAITGPVFAPLTSSGDGMNYQVTVPAGVNGQSYLIFSDCNDTVTDSNVVAGPTIVQITNPLPMNVTNYNS